MPEWIDHADHLVPLLVAMVCGALLGCERERQAHQAGLRTTMLITVGSALFAALGRWMTTADFGGGDAVSLDPTRMASYVAAGVGFLGAGTIMRHGGRMHGLTTAATVWVAAAIGTCAGLRFYLPALLATASILIVLAALRPFRDLIRPPESARTIDVAIRRQGMNENLLEHLTGEYRAEVEILERHDALLMVRIRYAINHREATEFLHRLEPLTDPQSLPSGCRE